MKLQIAILAVASALALTNAKNILGWGQEEIAPRPGALALSVNTTSVNNLIQTFVPIMAYFSLQNHTFDIGLVKKTFFYEFDLKDIHVSTATGFTEKQFAYVPGTDKIHARIGGVNLTTLVDADLKALHVIPFESSQVNITNLSLDLVFQNTPGKDGTHWSLAEKAVVNFDDMHIGMKNPALNELVKLSRPLINKIVLSVLLPKAEDYLESVVTDLNNMIANEGAHPYDFEVPITNDLTLNLTMTTATKTTAGSDLIEIFFDGIFDAPEGQPRKSDLYHGDVTNYPPRLQHSLSEQVWIHEDTFDSLMKVGGADIFPYQLNNADVTGLFLKTFPEVEAYYGKQSMHYLRVAHKDGPGKPITFSRAEGIVYGGASNHQITTLEIVSSNFTTYNETSLMFEFNHQVAGNLTMHNLIVYGNCGKNVVSNVRVTKDAVSLASSHKLDAEMQAVSDTLVEGINKKYANGWALANLDPTIGMLGGLLKNTTVTPYVTDQWILAGFEMQADLPTSPQLDFMM
jgi:hypothetical protein